MTKVGNDGSCVHTAHSEGSRVEDLLIFVVPKPQKGKRGLNRNWYIWNKNQAWFTQIFTWPEIAYLEKRNIIKSQENVMNQSQHDCTLGVHKLCMCACVCICVCMCWRKETGLENPMNQRHPCYHDHHHSNGCVPQVTHASPKHTGQRYEVLMASWGCLTADSHELRSGKRTGDNRLSLTQYGLRDCFGLTTHYGPRTNNYRKSREQQLIKAFHPT